MKRLLFVLTIACIVSCKELPDDFAVTDELMRSELVKMSLPEQRSIFSSLDSEKKAELYQFKIKKDLKTRGLSRQEKKVLEEILDYCKPEAYNNLSDNQDLENKFVAELDALGWSAEKIFKYTMTFMTADEFDLAYPDAE